MFVQRWNAIRPDRTVRPWTNGEDAHILAFQKENGNKWLDCAESVSVNWKAQGGVGREWRPDNTHYSTSLYLSSAPWTDQLRLQEPLFPHQGRQEDGQQGRLHDGCHCSFGGDGRGSGEEGQH